MKNTTIYMAQKENLEAQGWRAYRKLGETVYFCKDGISGIIITVNTSTGEALTNTGAPKHFADKHSPILLTSLPLKTW